MVLQLPPELNFFTELTPGLPLQGWWMGAAVLALLGASAWVDARTGRVPDAMMALGAVIAALGLSIYLDPMSALLHLGEGVVAGGILWALNEIWFRLFKHDAFGMGDAKWSALAVTVFGALPVVASWVIGAWSAIVFLLAARLMKHKTAHVHFAPFLFGGLLMALWFVYRLPI